MYPEHLVSKLRPFLSREEITLQYRLLRVIEVLVVLIIFLVISCRTLAEPIRELLINDERLQHID